MSAIAFIAVQCFQCSTMQVKQQKKNSNKWNCVVCNHKQSVRKVFAQGFQAKDVRKFVQSFNMSRQLADQNLIQVQIEPPPTSEQTHHPCQRKRSDWTEYLDYEGLEIPAIEEEVGGGGFEQEVVIELPKEMFKKPKLKSYSAELKNPERSNLFNPSFSKRNTSQEKTATGKSQPTVMTQGTLKWNDYLTQDEEDLLLGADEDLLDNRFADQRVEDEIHPDFIW